MFLIGSFEIIVHLLKAVTCCQALPDLKINPNFARFYWFTRQLVDKIRTPFLYVFLAHLISALISFCFQLVPKAASWFYLPRTNLPKNWSTRVNIN